MLLRIGIRPLLYKLELIFVSGTILLLVPCCHCFGFPFPSSLYYAACHPTAGHSLLWLIHLSFSTLLIYDTPHNYVRKELGNLFLPVKLLFNCIQSLFSSQSSQKQYYQIPFHRLARGSICFSLAPTSTPLYMLGRFSDIRFLCFTLRSKNSSSSPQVSRHLLFANKEISGGAYTNCTFVETFVLLFC